MKKTLLMQVLALGCTVAANAYEVGDYLYTDMEKYKVIGANQVTNGDFAAQFEGWNDESGSGDVNTSFWAVQLGVGPAGENVAESQTATVDEGVEGYALTNVWMLDPGLYAITYNIKGTEAGMTSVTVGTQNYVDIFVNTDGSRVFADGMRRVAEAAPITDQWATISDTVLIADGEVLVFNASKLMAGTQLTGFAIHQVQQVYDTRVTDRLLAYYHALLAEESLSEGQDELIELLDDFEDQMQNPANAESESFVNSYLPDLESAYREFLDANGATTTGVVGAWGTQSSTNWNRVTSIGSWQLQGGRWGISNNDATLERPEGDGFVVTAGIQTSFDLAVGLRVENSSLPAGKYLFKIEAQAVAAGNKAAPYGADFSKPIVGPSIYVGNDTTFLENDTISGRYWKTYYKIFEIQPGQVPCAGFRFPEYTDKRGGRYSLRNPEFYALGKTVAEVEYNMHVNQVIAKQISLKGRIDLAKQNDALAKADGYPWAHQQLKDSLAIYEPVYNNSLATVSADSIVAEGTTTAQLDELLAELTTADSRLATANNYFANHNKPYQDLVEALAAANASISDPEHASGDKAPFQAVIDEAQAMIDAVAAPTDENDLGSEFAEETTKLQAAQVVFESTCASYAAPAGVIIANAKFTKGGTGSPASGEANPGTGSAPTGWTFVDNGSWDKHKYADYTSYGIDSYAYAVWRGNSVSPRVKLSQTVTVSKAGVYELKAYAYALRSNNNGTNLGSDYSIVTLTDEEGVVNDTIYNSNSFYVFMGENGAPDSVYTHSQHFEADNLYYMPERVAAIFVKTDATPVEVELGFENTGADGTGYNIYGAGDFQLTYGGTDVDAYVAASKAALTAEIAAAKTLAANAAGNELAAFLVVKLNRLIAAGEAALATEGSAKAILHATENALLNLQSVEARIEPVLAGIDGVAADMQRLGKGVYNLSGVQVAADKAGLQNLKKGLYIFNGRKYIVK
mgnify:CR=1 FL=1